MKALYLANAPMTAQALELGLTAEEWDECRVVYEKDKDGGGYVFHSLWSPKGEYGGEHIIMPLGSIYDGLSDEEFATGTCFANATDTKNDPKYHGAVYDISWIEVIRRAYRDTGYSAECCCAERNIIYRAKSNDVRIPGFACTNDGVPRYDKDKSKCIYLHGAHVFMRVKENFKPADDGPVYLLPLCAAHNTYSLDRGTWGQGYYMKLGRPMKAVKLRGFMHKPEGELPV